MRLKYLLPLIFLFPVLSFGASTFSQGGTNSTGPYPAGTVITSNGTKFVATTTPIISGLTIGSSTPNVGGYSGRGLTVSSALTPWLEYIRHIATGNSIVGTFRAGNDSNSTLAGIDFRSGTTDTAGVLTLSTATSGPVIERMRLDENGKMSLGTSTSSAFLTVQGAPGSNPFTVSSSTGNTLFTILPSGNVG